MKKARVVSILFLAVLLAVAGIAEAQQLKRVPRIGYLANTAEGAGAGGSGDSVRTGIRHAAIGANQKRKSSVSGFVLCVVAEIRPERGAQ